MDINEINRLDNQLLDENHMDKLYNLVTEEISSLLVTIIENDDPTTGKK